MSVLVRERFVFWWRKRSVILLESFMTPQLLRGPFGRLKIKIKIKVKNKNNKNKSSARNLNVLLRDTNGVSTEDNRDNTHDELMRCRSSYFREQMFSTFLQSATNSNEPFVLMCRQKGVRGLNMTSPCHKVTNRCQWTGQITDLNYNERQPHFGEISSNLNNKLGDTMDAKSIFKLGNLISRQCYRTINL